MKNKNKDYPKYVQAMHLMDAGVCISKVSRELHVAIKKLALLRVKYLRGGELAMMVPEYVPRKSASEKYLCIVEVLNNELSLREASLKHEIQVDTLREWYRAYLLHGMEGLERKNKSGIMARKKVYTEAQLDELERLRRRNEYLEAENALLKKVKALVEEREARLRATGQKPSRD